MNGNSLMFEKSAINEIDSESKKTQIKIETAFFCQSLQMDLIVGSCIDRYVEANAFGFKESACFKCPQGLRIRQLLAHD